MNQTTKRQYDSAYRQLANGETVTYRQESGQIRVDGEWVAGTATNANITCYQDSPSTSDIDKGLASVTDVKLLVASKAMPLVVPKKGDVVIFADKTLTVKQLDPVKSLEGVTVLHQLFCSAMV